MSSTHDGDQKSRTTPTSWWGSVATPWMFVALVAAVAVGLGLIFADTPPMTDWSSLIAAIAQLLEALQWPLVALILSLLCRPDIRALLPRLKRFKMGPAEGELIPAVAEFVNSPPDPTALDPPGSPKGLRPQDEARRATDPENDRSRTRSLSELAENTDLLKLTVRQLEAVSPTASVMFLGSAIELKLRELAEEAQRQRQPTPSEPGPRLNRPIYHLIDDLVIARIVQFSTAQRIQRFWKVRNIVAHAQEVDEEELLLVVPSGILILDELDVARVLLVL